MARENLLHRAIHKRLEKIRLFPTIVSDSGLMLEGISKEEQIEAFLNKIAKTRKNLF